MKRELYEKFLSLKERGQKAEAKAVLDEFINSFQSFDEKALWAREFLERGEFGHKIRHELYEHIIFPALLDGYQQRQAWSIWQLAKTARNLYAVKALHSQIGFKTEYALLQEAYDLEPLEEVRNELLHTQLQWFYYSDHEWPLGILFWGYGDPQDECDALLQEVEYARQLDVHNKYEARFNMFEARVKEYKQRLLDRQES